MEMLEGRFLLSVLKVGKPNTLFKCPKKRGVSQKTNPNQSFVLQTCYNWGGKKGYKTVTL